MDLIVIFNIISTLVHSCVNDYADSKSVICYFVNGNN